MRRTKWNTANLSVHARREDLFQANYANYVSTYRIRRLAATPTGINPNPAPLTRVLLLAHVAWLGSI